MSDALTLDRLKKLVETAVAIRGAAILEPAGGPHDKVFPPTHSVDERKATTRYAFESRRIEGQDIACVLLDSVQSQANRMEEALQSLWADKRVSLPVITVDFSECARDVGVVTSLTAPHRIADALLRDSLLDGKLFRMSDLGNSFTDATAKNAAPLFKVCPTGLVFGLWDSTGPKGGLGSKFARALVSEIVGINAANGKKTASRIDPAGIVTASGPLYIKTRAAEEPLTWTLDPAEAAKDEKGKEALKWGSKLKDGKWAQGDGKPSEANHSNIPPTIDTFAGGVTIDHASHTVVLSLAALRKLSFGGDDLAARTVLAALGLLAVLAAENRGHDLRSRCLLVPRKGHALKLEAVRRDGETEKLSLDFEEAVVLYDAAVAALPEALRFTAKKGEPIATLKPSRKLADLVKKSRELSSTGAGDEKS